MVWFLGFRILWLRRGGAGASFHVFEKAAKDARVNGSNGEVGVEGEGGGGHGGRLAGAGRGYEVVKVRGGSR